jgi:hypothetical protein
MDNTDSENSEYNTKYASMDNKNAIDSDKVVIHVDKTDNQIYGKGDEDHKLTTIINDISLNPFTATMDMWQNYVKIWTDTYKQLAFKNPSMPNGEFWFMYCRFDSKSKEQ